MVKNITQHKGQGYHQANLLPNDHDRGLQDDHPKDLNGEPMIITARSKNGSPANRGAAAPPCSGGGSPPRFCDYNPVDHLSHNVSRRFLTTDAARRAISPSAMEARAIVCHLHDLNEVITTASPRPTPHLPPLGLRTPSRTEGSAPPSEKSSLPCTEHRCTIDTACPASPYPSREPLDLCFSD
jgi:hypothetical protein